MQEKTRKIILKTVTAFIGVVAAAGLYLILRIVYKAPNTELAPAFITGAVVIALTGGVLVIWEKIDKGVKGNDGKRVCKRNGKAA